MLAHVVYDVPTHNLKEDIKMKNLFRRQLLIFGLAVIIAIFMASSGFAHMPYWSEGEFVDQETAMMIDDIEASILVYNEVTCDSEQLWLTFDAQPEEKLFVQLGTPLLERLRDYYPSMAILAKGLPEPEQELPFEIPEGLGAIVIETDEDTEYYEYFEEFSETDFVIMFEEEYVLKEGGVGYVVAWHPERRTGKLYTAVGTREDFNDEILAKYVTATPALHAFHEVEGEKTEAEVPAEYCGAEDGGGNCSLVPTRNFRTLLTTLVQLLFSF